MRIQNIKGGVIQINGKKKNKKNLVISNKQVIIDGIIQEDINLESQIINIQITGNVGDIQNEAGDITVSGSVSGNVKTASGDIECGDVQGNAKSMSGDIKCGVVHGDVSTMSGDIRHR